MGMIEIWRFFEQVDLIIGGNEDSDLKKLYSTKPHITCDNYFSGEIFLIRLDPIGLDQMVLVQQWHFKEIGCLRKIPGRYSKKR